MILGRNRYWHGSEASPPAEGTVAEPIVTPLPKPRVKQAGTSTSIVTKIVTNVYFGFHF